MLPTKGRSGGSIKDNKKMIFDRIQNVENTFGALCTELSSFAKKKARLRDKYDELSGLFKQAADIEESNETLHNGLNSYSKALTLLADINDMEVQRLHGKVVHELANYELICKNTRELMKHSLLMRDKEMIRRHHLDQIKQRSQPRNIVIENVESDSEASKSSQALDHNIVTFEQRKIEDIKQIMLDLTLIQLKQHVKSMEILSVTYKNIFDIDVTNDIDAFKSKFLLHPDSKSFQAQIRSQSMNALTSILPSTKGVRRQNLSTSVGSLESPKRIVTQSNGKQSPSISSVEMDRVVNQTDESTATESNDDDDDDVDETTSHDESDSDKEIIQVTRRINRIAANDDDDDDDEDDVEHRKYKLSAPSSSAIAKKQGKKVTAKKPPVPQVRLSKIALNHSKST